MTFCFLIELFKSLNQQDAHEFFNFIINDLSDNIRKNQKPNIPIPNSQKGPVKETWIQELFEGILSNETRCLTCDNVSKYFSIFTSRMELQKISFIPSD